MPVVASYRPNTWARCTSHERGGAWAYLAAAGTSVG